MFLKGNTRCFVRAFAGRFLAHFVFYLAKWSLFKIDKNRVIISLTCPLFGVNY